METTSLNDHTATVSQLREWVVKFRDERNWEQFHNPKDLVSAISIEVAELAELFLWRTNQETQQDLLNAEFRKSMEEEMSDILTLFLSLSAIAKVDITTALEKKLAKNAQKYPVNKSYGSAKKYDRLPGSE